MEQSFVGFPIRDDPVRHARKAPGRRGMGFSAAISPAHRWRWPARHASREEWGALAGLCRDHPGTTLEFLPGPSAFTNEICELMTDLSLAADRPLNWKVLAADASKRRASRSDYIRARHGGRSR